MDNKCAAIKSRHEKRKAWLGCSDDVKPLLGGHKIENCEWTKTKF